MEIKDAIKTIEDIYKVCQNTPEHDKTENQLDEAIRLEKCVAKINKICDTFLAIYKRENKNV